MDLKEILAISGKPGLYKLVSQTKTGAIVESLTDGKRFPAFAHEKISSLEEISIFIENDDIPLKEVLKKIHEKQAGGPAPDPKGETEVVRAFFEEVLPEYDRDRVYHSDIKKVLTWYNLLLEKEMLDFTEEESTEEEKDKPEAGDTGKAEETEEDKEEEKKE
ncbi:MAG: DUF5606 domain-containing protein [Bacteroidetes bacterium]|nr:DUF5606 domain-containing protein [Bacteroidota bacterium]